MMAASISAQPKSSRAESACPRSSHPKSAAKKDSKLMTTPAPVNEALGIFGQLLDEMEELMQ